MRQHARGTRPAPASRGARTSCAGRDLRRLLEAVAEAADDADQPLRPESDGSTGAPVSHEEHGNLPVQDGKGRAGGHQQAGHDQLVTTGWRENACLRARASLAAVLLTAACATPHAARESVPPAALAGPYSQACLSRTDDAWADCVIAHMSLRDKAAQMVWPQLFGDYVSADAPQWRKISGWVTDQHVGGVIMSVGSPLEIAAKLNALQRMSDLPLLVGGDLEFGAGYRARGGYFLPNGIDLGGAVLFPPEMAIGATRDTMLAYEQGRITAVEGRAIGYQIDFSPILDVNNNPANPVISTRSFGEDPALVAKLGAAFIRGVQENGMIATGKHFPGHGDTGTNSHLAL